MTDCHPSLAGLTKGAWMTDGHPGLAGLTAGWGWVEIVIYMGLHQLYRSTRLL
jgi:hypothetical protein